MFIIFSQYWILNLNICISSTWVPASHARERVVGTFVFSQTQPTFDFLLFVIGQWTRTRIGRKGIEFMAVSNGQGLATGPILWGDVGQIFKLGINGQTNTQIRCAQIQCKVLQNWVWQRVFRYGNICKSRFRWPTMKLDIKTNKRRNTFHPPVSQILTHWEFLYFCSNIPGVK